MPSLKQSARFNQSGWRQVTSPAASGSRLPASPPPPEDSASRDPLMIAPIPGISSSHDYIQRQFYGGTNVPKWRTLLPLKGVTP